MLPGVPAPIADRLTRQIACKVLRRILCKMAPRENDSCKILVRVERAHDGVFRFAADPEKRMIKDVIIRC